MISGYPIDGAMGHLDGGRVRKLSDVCLHNNAILARGILVTNIALWDTRTASAPSILLVLLEPHYFSQLFILNERKTCVAYQEPSLLTYFYRLHCLTRSSIYHVPDMKALFNTVFADRILTLSGNPIIIQFSKI